MVWQESRVGIWSLLGRRQEAGGKWKEGAAPEARSFMFLVPSIGNKGYDF